MSLPICTKSPTTNCDEEPAPVEIALDPDAVLVDGAVEDRAEGVERERTLLEVSDGPVVTLVRMAGLNVHLNNKRGTVQEVSFSATQKPLQQICSHFTSNGGTVNQSIFFLCQNKGRASPPYQSEKLMYKTLDKCELFS